MKQDHDSSVDAGAKDTGQPSVEGLVARLEQATEGSRELDAEIYLSLSEWKNAEVVVQAFPRSEMPSRPTILRRTVDNHVVTYSDFPAYTSSIDAALPGEQIEVVSIQRAPPGHPQKWSALDANWPRNADGQYTCMRIAGIGHTEALARRIAALRARQAVPQTDFGDKPQAEIGSIEHRQAEIRERHNNRMWR